MWTLHVLTTLSIVALIFMGLTEEKWLFAGGVAAGMMALTAVVVIRTRRGRGKIRRPVEAVLAEVDQKDAAEAPEEEFQPLFDELLSHLIDEAPPALVEEIARRVRRSQGPSRRMFLQLAAVHPELQGVLRDLSESAHPLAAEARELLRRREANPQG